MTRKSAQRFFVGAGDHAQAKIQSAMTVHPNLIAL
jgi:hypothetical protein